MALKFTSNELVEIGRRVQDARVAKRMTQEYVADQCDCTTKHIMLYIVDLLSNHQFLSCAWH